MKVLITGAAGFVGSYLAESLLRDGHAVRGFVRPTKDTSVLERLGVEVARGDLVDPTSVERALQGCNQVYHLAALTSRQKPSRKEAMEVNCEGTRHVVRAALKAGVSRMVYSSTAGVYGMISKAPVDEASPVNPDSPYQEAKVAGEALVLTAHRDHQFPVVIARFPGLLGRGSMSWVPLFQAIGTGKFRIIGSGRNHTHTGHVLDIVDGLRRCGEAPNIEGQCYLLAGKSATRIDEFVELIAKELRVSTSSMRLPDFPYRVFHGLSCLSYRLFGGTLPRANDYELFISDKVLSLEKAKRELGFEPKIPIEQGIRETLQWYREQGLI
ncbi:NAD-dependent epimerase/dehydratase family protein [Nitrospira sp. T9]|uniref:NAD-dependent epimerase/dehydratase family protein n=1 Tax=unclassified Nitrospira TaxID=2652172 RepID=UPI003F9815F2